MASKTKAPKPMSVSPSRSQNERVSVSARKIENGYLVCESRSSDKGYTDREYFSPTKPKLSVAAVTGAGKRGGK